LRWEDADSIT